MKKYLLFFLLLSTITYSQNLSLYDIKQIDSKEQFERVMIENGFEYVEWDEYKNVAIRYAYNYSEETNKATTWYIYYLSDNSFEFQMAEDEDYNYIFNQVKEECAFYAVLDDPVGRRMSTYTCQGSKYQGVIGFTKGNIQNIIIN